MLENGPALVADPATDAVRLRMIEAKVDASETQFITSDDELFNRSDDIDALLIGTRCNLHAGLATRWAKAKKPLFLEKPVGLHIGELQALADASIGRESRYRRFSNAQPPLRRSVRI